MSAALKKIRNEKGGSLIYSYLASNPAPIFDDSIVSLMHSMYKESPKKFVATMASIITADRLSVAHPMVMKAPHLANESDIVMSAINFAIDFLIYYGDKYYESSRYDYRLALILGNNKACIMTGSPHPAIRGDVVIKDFNVNSPNHIHMRDIEVAPTPKKKRTLSTIRKGDDSYLKVVTSVNMNQLSPYGIKGKFIPIREGDRHLVRAVQNNSLVFYKYEDTTNIHFAVVKLGGSTGSTISLQPPNSCVNNVVVKGHVLHFASAPKGDRKALTNAIAGVMVDLQERLAKT